MALMKMEMVIAELAIKTVTVIGLDSMTSMVKTHAFLVLVLLMNTALLGLEARPLSIIGTANSATPGDQVDFFDWLALGAMKDPGPSPGVGHEFTNSDTLGGIKDSGPSPGGKGHKFTNSNTLGGIKDSGPSGGGEGHKFTNSETLGGIKESGPSPGQGH
ncbi:unnamed protein product [Sphenostylis stenocarpa]|uniref:Uncharacterized protein n=1 Tax=Sphenostylis stenocarpa TaxID=92480 RepID=A0AA86SCX8_9FABA|nr:unnamed protein product [Sphenostylis stenocarpa]